MTSYLPPPSIAAGGAEASQPPQLEPEHHPQQPGSPINPYGEPQQPQHQFGGANIPSPPPTDAQYALHALQAASSGPAAASGPSVALSPQRQQHHPALMPPQGVDIQHHYMASDPRGTMQASVASPPTHPTAKATRLRRACDMCSQRKIKVCQAPPYFRADFEEHMATDMLATAV